MPKVVQAGDFFVVGGPVQPDRACYVERAADTELARGIAEQRFCYVLSARSTGKSSLMARAIRSLRRERQLAAVVDLNQIGARADSTDAVRWYYGIAYRILRELRLKVDLQAWWQEKSALTGEQRLAEFFWDVVLASTSVPVTVFIDEIERALELPFAQDLFAAIQACYSRRASEPDYARLNFVVLGIASPSTLCPDPNLSPFIDGQAVEPADFTLEQCMQLAPGLGVDAAAARELIARIHEWTAGQPYLTQKIARGVARRGGRLQDVDRVVREQFLAPAAGEKEPYLNHIRATLTRRGTKQRHALALLAKVARGIPVADEPSTPPRELLRLAGVTAAGQDGVLRYRNRILRDVFTERWISAVRPFDWRGAAAIAAVLAVATVVPIWYTQVLPQPYLRTLSVVTQDFAVAEEAYEKLHRLPGFAGTADRLLAEAMARRSRGADSYAEVMAADRVLRKLPEQAWLADQLLADYWLRRARNALHAERRDQALLFAMQAQPGREVDVRRMAAGLIGEDYSRLARTFRFGERPVRWAIDWDAGRLAVVDAAHRAQRLPLRLPATKPRTGGAAPAAEPGAGLAPAAATSADTLAATPEPATDELAPIVLPGRLTALQHVPVRREVGVEETGSAGAFLLQLRVQHPRPDDLLVALAAPSGATARLELEQQSAGQEIWSFNAVGSSPLTELADEGRHGVWRLTIVDRRTGAVGVLLRWGLQFSETGREWLDAPEQGIAVPDPGRTEQVDVEVSADGRYAVARPAREGAFGALAVWNLADGGLVHDLEMQSDPEYLAFNADGTRLLVESGNALSLWDVERGERVARIETQTEFVLPPALSVDGDFVAIAERVEEAAPLFSIVRVEDGAFVASAEGVRGAQRWVLGPAARYAAVLDGSSRVVAVLDPRRGPPSRQLRHERAVERLIPVPAGDLLLTIDAAGDIRAWRIGSSPAARAAGGWRLGTTVDPESVSVSADGSTVAFEGAHGEVVVCDVNGELEGVHLRVDASGRVVETGVAPDGHALVTENDGLFRVWRLDDRALADRRDPNVSALAIDSGGAVAALGFRGGHVRVRSASELARAEAQPDTIDYIGHRGPVTSLDINVPRGLVASGGDNGVVRLWDLASVAPTEHFMRHPVGPVHAVDISPDGRWVASAAEYSARVWRTEDGTLSSELSVNGTALAVAFSADSKRWAVGDSAGNVFIGTSEGSNALGSVRAQGPVRAVAFSPDGRLLASGDEIGNVELWDLDTFGAAGPRRAFAHAVRWIGFAGSASTLLVQTDHFIHRVEISGGRLTVVASRLLDVGLAAGAALASSSGEAVRLVGGLGGETLAVHDVSFDPSSIEPLAAGSPLLGRDWSAALGLRIDSDGEVVARAP